MKKILASIVVLVAASLAFFFRTGEEVVVAEEFGSEPRIEVVAQGVFLKNSSAEKRALRSGETLLVPSEVETDTTGVAIIHFPDGSQARIDPGSSLKIVEGSYEEKSSSLKVKLSLSAGRVWSKVVDLATTESRWQVETAHTVATVRGTAFGVEVGEKRSAVLGSQHKVAVAPKDPKTGQVIKEREILVSEKQYVEVDTGGKGTPVVKAAEIKPEVATWAEQNEKEDVVIDAKFERRDVTREEIRRELLQNIIQRFDQAPIQSPEVRADVQAEATLQGSVEKPLEPTTQVAPKTVEPVPIRTVPKTETTPTSEVKTPISATSPATSLSIKEIVIVPDRKLTSFEEGQAISFKAFVVHSDGSRVDATARVAWRVVGEIGFMKAPGLFVGKLSDQVSELGQAKGVVAATLKDTKTGVEHLGKTEIFEIRAAVVQETELQG